MNRYLFIAEKPSLMRDVKASYEKHRDDIEKKVGSMDFIALAGHVCRLIEPKEYDGWDKPWKDLDLPLIPASFKIDVISSSKNIVSDIKKKLSTSSYDGLIVGTDADMEGNGIFYLLSQYLHITDIPALRFYLDDQTDKGIFKAFMEMTDFYEDPKHVHMTESYLIRSHMDWLIGMNFTIGASVKSGFTMKVGRIKTPTLKLIYDNCKAIDDFEPHTDFAVDCTYGEGFTGSLVDEEGKSIRFESEEEAGKFSKSLGNTAKVTSVEKKREKKGAPLLYSLSDLQQDAGAKYKYTPEKTLDIVQSLYETHKIVSYPRTSGRYVSSAKAEDFPELIKACAYIPELSKYTADITPADIDRAKKNKKMVNDEEVSKASHDALMPTGEKPDPEKLSADELNICTMIYKRFIAHFMPDLEEDKTVILTDIDGNTFKSNGKVTAVSGWTQLYDKKSEDTEIPEHKKGDILDVKEYTSVEKTTQPPKRYTQASLIGAMINAAKFVDDKNLKDAMKESEGLGQESSRAKIISDLIKDGYMEDKKGGLFITDTGKKYIENLMGYSITDPVLTAEWEYKMKELRQGKRDYDSLEKEMLEYVKSTVKEIETSEMKRVSWSGGTSETGYKCPVCGAPLLNGKYGFFCSERKNGCSFSLQNTVAGKKLTDKQMSDLLTKGETSLIKGFKSKAGKSFDARLKMTVEDGKAKTSFVFDNDAEKKKTKNSYVCPVCGGTVINDKWAWKCENDCGFSVSYKIAGREMSESELADIINEGSTGKLNGFTSKAGKKFSARIRIDDKGKTSFNFD